MVYTLTLVLIKCRRLLPNKHYEAFPEESEVEEINIITGSSTNPVLTSIKPAQCNSVLCSGSPAFAENPRGKAFSSPAPANKKSGCQMSLAGHPTIQITPDAEVFKGGEMAVTEEPSFATSQSITSSSMESDTTFSSDDDDDDEEDCYSSASSASSSLPSPEIFRKDDYVETLTFPVKEELLGPYLHIKNSTLLDVSHAESIHMHHLPNLSNIDASAIPAENNCEINPHRGPEAETDKAFKLKTPPELANRRPILYKKKVWFKSPMIADIFEVKHTPATRLTIHNASEAVQASEQGRPEADTSRAGEINSKEEALRLTVRLKRPVKSSPGKAKFFDFSDNSDRDAFFQGMRERCDKLIGAPPFPLASAKCTEPSVL
ncbi:uncharacterized protein LOC127363764 isoform X2 [Dicentrarchus labrax]|uniref:uncharacterized protein LOC127363764 isoform X2 n=1 Tax=Dicentrarchus labrax TaxID=13489 RepID=UPI0021F5340C|nr:uncharacterized protein LOC127363764 isoform X2 [Dicentrarchus labrax]